MTPIDTSDVSRRTALEKLGALVALGLTGGCGAAAATDATSGTEPGSANAACVVTPTETEGPYPDKTGMISNSAFFRRDITEGRAGVPLTLTLTVVNTNQSCAAVANAAVEIWQCDAGGLYSEYSQPGYDGTGKTFLRGLQTTDATGKVTFTTIYPGWYAGRATHIHVDVFVSGSLKKTTQIAFPEDVTAAVYKTGVYAAKGLNSTTNAGDMVFSDGTKSEMATLVGTASAGYVATLQVGIAL